MPERSQATKLVLRQAEKLAGFDTPNLRRAEPPFMQERLSKRDLRNRFKRWSDEERRAWIAENGVEAAIDLVRDMEEPETARAFGSSPAERPNGLRPFQPRGRMV